MKRLLRGILFFLVAAVLAFAFLAFDVYSFDVDADPAVADAAIVLGGGVGRDRPSPSFQERINHGIDLLKSGKVRRILLTGGRPDGNELSESFIAQQYAVECGVPEELILAEERSHNTYQNLYYARELAKENDLHTFVVVSDPYHLRRAMRMARELGLDAHASGTPTSKLNTADFLLRETWRNASYLVRHSLTANAEADELAVGSH